MIKSQIRLLSVPPILLGLASLWMLAERRPGYFTNPTYLVGLVFIQVIFACIWRFRTVFFPATMGCFLVAGTSLPLAVQSFTLRWAFLTVGALVGLVIWIKTDRERHFESFHLVALFCVFAAMASASASITPSTGLLKVASLFLLFLYASTGGRIALLGREEKFVRGLVRAAELSAFLIGAAYLVGYRMFGNPNNLGAFIGVMATPLLLWGALTAENRAQRQRRWIALAVCGVLLYYSVCRAAIAADVILLIVMTFALRRPRMLVQAGFAAALLLEIMAVANPAHMSEFVDALTGKFVYKMGQTHPGILGSRQSPWEETLSAVKKHPWFGTGFGTSDMGEPDTGKRASIYTIQGSNREHGSSYLALAEYMGMLGILPFLLLLIFLARRAAQVYAWTRRTASPNHYSVPFAMVVLTGLVHAGFEDWLFAAGSYVCLFFWVSSFLLADLVPEPPRKSSYPQTQPIPAYATRIYPQPTASA